jgi:hypothetical protein
MLKVGRKLQTAIHPYESYEDEMLICDAQRFVDTRSKRPTPEPGQAKAEFKLPAANRSSKASRPQKF